MLKLNSKHFMFFMAGVSIISLKTYPTLLTSVGGRDTWIAVIIACALVILFVAFLLSACKKTNQYELHVAYADAFGKWLGGFFLVLFILSMLLTVFESSSVESNVLKSNFFIRRQVWSYMLVTVLAAIFVVRKGGAAMVTTTLITIFLITVVGVFLAILTQKYKEFKYLFPIFGHGLTAGFFLAILKGVGSMGCVSLLLPILPSIADKEKLTKNGIWGMVYVTQMEIVAIIGAITTFGINRMNELLYPKLLQTQLISYFGFLEFGELFVMLQVVAGWFLKFIITIYCLTLLARQLGLKARGIEIKIGVLAYAMGLFIANKQLLLIRCLDVFLYVEFVNFVLLPFVAYAILLIKRKMNKRVGYQS